MTDPVLSGTQRDEITRVAPVVGYQADPAIARFAAEMLAVRGEFLGLIEPLTAQQLNWRPSDGRWSIAECMAHLTAAGQAYIGAIDNAVERGRARGYLGGREYQPGRVGRWLIAQMEPPPRRQMSAPKKIVPQRVESAAALRGAYEAMHHGLTAAVMNAEGVDLSRVKVASPLMPLLRLPLGTWLGFLAAHERRHLWQARQVRQEPGFPR